MSRVLLTGGWGALGSSLASQMRAAGYDVTQAGRSLPVGQTAMRMDVRNYEDVCSAIAIARPEIVVHLSAVFSDDFEASLSTNVFGAKNVLAALKENKIQARVLLAGSAAEYGLVHPEENPVKVDQVLRPLSIYGLTKSWQSQWGISCSYSGQDVVVARIFNLNGPGLSERLFVGRIHKQIELVKAGETDKIATGPLSAIRDYISLRDAGQQLMAVLRGGKSGSIYNIASGKPISMRDLLDVILNQHGLSMDFVVEGLQGHGRSGFDVPMIYADTAPTFALMGAM